MDLSEFETFHARFTMPSRRSDVPVVSAATTISADNAVQLAARRVCIRSEDSLVSVGERTVSPLSLFTDNSGDLCDPSDLSDMLVFPELTGVFETYFGNYDDNGNLCDPSYLSDLLVLPELADASVVEDAVNRVLPVDVGGGSENVLQPDIDVEPITPSDCRVLATGFASINSIDVEPITPPDCSVLDTGFAVETDSQLNILVWFGNPALYTTAQSVENFSCCSIFNC